MLSARHHTILFLLAWIFVLSGSSLQTARAAEGLIGKDHLQPATPTDDKSTATYTGGVYLDLNLNGEWEALHEPGANAITVVVETMEGTVIGQTESNEEGYYVFTDLPLQELRIHVQPPPGYRITARGTYTIATHLPSGAELKSTGLAEGVSLYLPMLQCR